MFYLLLLRFLLDHMDRESWLADPVIYKHWILASRNWTTIGQWQAGAEKAVCCRRDLLMNSSQGHLSLSIWFIHQLSTKGGLFSSKKICVIVTFLNILRCYHLLQWVTLKIGRKDCQNFSPCRLCRFGLYSVYARYKLKIWLHMVLCLGWPRLIKILLIKNPFFRCFWTILA